MTMDMEAECCARAREEWSVYVLLSRDSLNHLPIVSHSQHFVFLTLFSQTMQSVYEDICSLIIVIIIIIHKMLIQVF